MSQGPLAAYRALCRDGVLREDPSQELAAEKLQSLHLALQAYQPRAGQALGLDRAVELWQRWGRRSQRALLPQGLYLFGGVGRGKSMLMELFYAQAPVVQKQRLHFHRFMLSIHDALHERRRARPRPAESDGIAEIASAMAKQSWLLCFDEFQVNNVADAMILGRLLQAMLDLGVVMVITSNRAPDELYPGGLQRERFKPCIALLESKLDLLSLDEGTDYRRQSMGYLPVYHCPLGVEASRGLGATFSRLTAQAKGGSRVLSVQGRRLDIPYAAGTGAWFQFYDLCGKPLGAADYLLIARQFETVVIDQVPRLRAEQRNEVTRLITLIDILYEHRVKVLISAAAPPDDLYSQGAHIFEFRRTASRLVEMQTSEYLALPHLT